MFPINRYLDPSSQLNRQLWRISWPIGLGAITHTVLMITDQAMVARVKDTLTGQPDPDAIAVAGEGSMLFWVFGSIAIGIAMGIQAIVARRIGEKNPRQAGMVLEVGVLAALAVGCVIGYILWHILPYLLPYIVHADIQQECLQFARLRYLGLPLYFALFAVRAFYDGIGRPIVGFISAVCVMLSNIGLNYALIFGIEGWVAPMGTLGAAKASTISAVPGLLILLPDLLRPAMRTYFQGQPIAGPAQVLRGVINIGWPAGLEQFITNIAFIIFLAFANWISVQAAAITTLIFAILSISFMPGFALGIASATLLGQAIGRRQTRQGIALVHRGAHLAALVMGLLGLFFIFTGQWLIALFNVELVEIGFLPLIIISIFQVCDGYNMVYASALRTAGMTMTIMLVIGIVSYLFFLPVSYLLGFTFGFGLIGIWIGLSAQLIILAFIFWFIFQKGRWIGRSV